MEQKDIEAFESMKISAEAGATGALYMLGRMYQLGQGTKANRPKAAMCHYLSACQRHSGGLEELQKLQSELPPEEFAQAVAQAREWIKTNSETATDFDPFNQGIIDPLLGSSAGIEEPTTTPVDMTDQEYQDLRSEALANLSTFLETPKNTLEEGMASWVAFAQHSTFLSLSHGLDPKSVDPSFYDDGEISQAQVDFYYTEHHLKEAWDGFEYQELLKENAFAIGYVNFLDEFIFCTVDSSKGIAIIHHDDVFCTDDIDELVERKLARFDCSFERLLKALEKKKKI